MRIAICDDKKFFHTDLKEKLEKFAFNRNLIFLYEDFYNGNELLAGICKTDFDLIFMDYQMDGIDGLETSKRLRANGNNTPVIFLTSFPHIVFDTFKVNAFRFIVKPVDDEKLDEALNDFLESLEDDKYIVVKNDEDNIRININDIIYAEANDKYCNIRLNNKVVLYKKTLSEFEKLVPQDKFFRSHRSYLVGLKHIVFHTTTDIMFDNNEKALISKLKHNAFKNAFLAYVKRYNFSDR